jgi:hypothetical protein
MQANPHSSSLSTGSARAVSCGPTYSYIYQNRSMHSLLITLVMETVSSSEKPVSIYQTTWRCIPEDSYLHILNFVCKCDYKASSLNLNLNLFTFHKS